MSDEPFADTRKTIKQDRSLGPLQSHVDPTRSLTLEKLMKAWRDLNPGEKQWYATPEETLEYQGPLYRKLLEDAAQGRTSFLSPQLESQIRVWCLHDERVDKFWRVLTERVHRGLNDEIVSGVFTALARLMTENDKLLQEANDRNLNNVRGIGGAARKVVKAYDDAERRGDVTYMEAAVEELEAALYEITHKEIDDDGAESE